MISSKQSNASLLQEISSHQRDENASSGHNQESSKSEDEDSDFVQLKFLEEKKE
jgi:hypothetical protein